MVHDVLSFLLFDKILVIQTHPTKISTLLKGSFPFLEKFEFVASRLVCSLP